jgi:roadblock/LC7 domain-containing protein
MNFFVGQQVAVPALCFASLSQAQNIPVAHWINDAGLAVTTVLNTNGVFVTDFKATNDLSVTQLTINPVGSMNGSVLSIYTSLR